MVYIKAKHCFISCWVQIKTKERVITLQVMHQLEVNQAAIQGEEGKAVISYVRGQTSNVLDVGFVNQHP